MEYESSGLPEKDKYQKMTHKLSEMDIIGVIPS